MSSIGSAKVLGFIDAQRVARLATSDKGGRPHLVPVCFTYDGARFYIPLDRKPKRVPPLKLKRVQNILSNPRVALLLDHYEEVWDKLAYVLIHGVAKVLEEGPEREKAIALLRERYPQYRSMELGGAPVIAIVPERVVNWGFRSGN